MCPFYTRWHNLSSSSSWEHDPDDHNDPDNPDDHDDSDNPDDPDDPRLIFVTACDTGGVCGEFFVMWRNFPHDEM